MSRPFLSLSIATALALATQAFVWIPTTPLTRPSQAASVRAGEWLETGPRFQLEGYSPGSSVAASVGIYTHTSVVWRAEFSFNALGFSWRGGETGSGDLRISFRTSQDGASWSTWTDAPVEQADGPDPGGRYFSELVTGLSASFLQYRLTVPVAGPFGQIGLSEVKAVYLDSTAGPSLQIVREPASSTAEAGAAHPQIISRAEWGADESLRFKDGKERWPARYRAAQKAIIHHTETPNDDPDPMATIRGIYYYHAVVKDWGDIGYNYLVDSQGNIYEGRWGGEDVVAGHAVSYNLGSMGIAILGSYSDAEVPAAAENSLVQLLAWKMPHLDPHGESFFIDKRLPNIMGHRDALPTDCPGDYLYQRLPEIRDRVQAAIGVVPVENLEMGEVTFSPAQVAQGENLEVRFVVTNTGTATVFSHGPGPGFVYNQGEGFSQIGQGEVEGKFRLAAGSPERADLYPYRWGFGDALQPGQSTRVIGYIRIFTPGTYTFWGALLEEGGGVRPDRLTPTSIVVRPQERSPNPADRMVPLEQVDPERIYFPESGHTLSYGFRPFWEENGGLPQFGYPLTEEIIELSPTDGQSRTVQYFERARFEYHQDLKGTPYEVQLGTLGSELTSERDFTWVEEFESNWQATFFKETSHSLTGAFLDYWRQTGGLARHGLPLSEEVQEINPDDGRTYTVQYFERSRLEYHREQGGTGGEIQLGLLGEESLKRRGWLR